MLLIGLTGPTGAGKSLVSKALSERGCFVMDGDDAAREAVMPGSPVLAELAGRFGPDAVRADGSLDRKLLAERAFSSPEGTAALNAITHPAITERIFERLAAAEKDGFTSAVIDAAALFESGIDGRCDIVAAVTAPKDVRLKRVMLRDGLDENAARLRMDAQKNEAYYEQRADMVIHNGNSDDLYAQIEKLYQMIVRKLEP